MNKFVKIMSVLTISVLLVIASAFSIIHKVKSNQSFNDDGWEIQTLIFTRDREEYKLDVNLPKQFENNSIYTLIMKLLVDQLKVFALW